MSVPVVALLLLPGLALAGVIKLASPGAALFTQRRVGKDGHPFTIYKFRTMSVQAPREVATGEFVNANEYITGLGGFLRKTSIDELPQLINVIKGDMSIIGPRPLITGETAVNEQRHRLGVDRVLPGITGLAQVNGRDMISDQEKLGYDLEYCQHLSMGLDLRIILKTIAKVAQQRDIRE